MGRLDVPGGEDCRGLVQTRRRAAGPCVSDPPEQFSAPRHWSTIDGGEPPEGRGRSDRPGRVLAPRGRLPFRPGRARSRTDGAPPAAPARRNPPGGPRPPETAVTSGGPRGRL